MRPAVKWSRLTWLSAFEAHADAAAAAGVCSREQYRIAALATSVLEFIALPQLLQLYQHDHHDGSRVRSDGSTYGVSPTACGSWYAALGLR